MTSMNMRIGELGSGLAITHLDCKHGGGREDLQNRITLEKLKSRIFRAGTSSFPVSADEAAMGP